MAKPTRTGVCVFCSVHGTLTREDVWPQWLMKALFPTGTILRKGWGEAGAEHGSKTASDLRVKVPRVCRKCNNEWMAELENTAGAILLPAVTGEDRPWTPANRMVVATWALKTSMMAQLAYPATMRPIPMEMYIQLNEEKDRPPPGVHVWARQNADAPAGNPLIFGVRPIAFDFGRGTSAYRFFEATILLGSLVLKVIGHNAPYALSLEMIFPNLQALASLNKIGLGFREHPPGHCPIRCQPGQA